MEEINQFKIAKGILAGVRDAEKQLKCEWGSLADVAFYKSDLRLSDRKKLLERLSPNRVCSECSELRISLKSWIVNKDRTKAICRSCYFRKSGTAIEGITENYNLFSGIEFRVAVNGHRIGNLRERIGISQNEFSRQCGWSQGYQSGIENGKFETISQMAAETIIEVFSNHGIVCKDVL